MQLSVKIFQHNSLNRAPGRVNIIGEHVDYCGFPVLPISIKHDVVIAARTDPQNRNITITNCDEAFEEISCPIRNIEVTFILVFFID